MSKLYLMIEFGLTTLILFLYLKFQLFGFVTMYMLLMGTFIRNYSIAN